MIYSGDEIATLNYYDYLNEEDKKHDNRWLHRPMMNWEIAQNLENYPFQKTVFDSLKKMIEVRKNTLAFEDRNDLEWIDSGNSHLLVYKKTDKTGKNIWIIANFSPYETVFAGWFIGINKNARNILTDETFTIQNQNFIGSYTVLWLELE